MNTANTLNIQFFRAFHRSIPELLSALILIFLLAGCGPDYTPDPERIAVENELSSLVEENGGRSAWIIPQRTNYLLLQDSLNPMNHDKVRFGQLLFSDPALNDVRVQASATSSCMSCHDPRLQGAAGIVQSLGEGGRGIGAGRYLDPYYAMHHPDSVDAPGIQSPSFFNLVFQKRTLWDASVGSDSLPAPEAQALVATDSVHHRHEPDAEWCQLPQVQDLLMRSFNDPTCSREQIAFAIAAFERSATTPNTKFQDWLRGLPYTESGREQMTLSEMRGARDFFRSGCQTCHSTPAFGGDGLATYDLYFPDLVSVHGLAEKDVSAVKPPMLYNLKDEPLYGHGGNYTTLPGVILAHSTLGGVEINGSLDDMVAFLTGALHDETVIDLIPESVPSGTCVGQRDLVTKRITGCN